MSALIQWSSESEQREYMHKCVKAFMGEDQYSEMTESTIEECYCEISCDVNHKVDREERNSPEIQEQKRATTEGF